MIESLIHPPFNPGHVLGKVAETVTSTAGADFLPQLAVLAGIVVLAGALTYVATRNLGSELGEKPTPISYRQSRTNVPKKRNQK